MNYVEKIMDGVQSLMNVNSATFSGAVDIIAVPQDDGSIACTSWHVRFGKLQLLNTSEKKILISINGQRVHGMRMRLGAAGNAYFVVETEEMPPSELRTEIDADGNEQEDDDSMNESNTLDDNSNASEMQTTEPVGSPEWSWGWGSLPHRSQKPKQSRESSSQYSNIIQLPVSQLLEGQDPHQLGIHQSRSASSVASYSAATRNDASPRNTVLHGSGEFSDLHSPSSHKATLNSEGVITLGGSSVSSALPSSSLPVGYALPQSTSPPVPKSDKATKTWGLNLFGFLRQKDSITPESVSSGSTNVTGSATTSTTPSIPTSQKSDSRKDNAHSPKDDDSYNTPLSSSLPNQMTRSWSPSTFYSKVDSDEGYASGKDDNRSEGGSRISHDFEEEEKSRAADDGSGIIYVGQKRTKRSSSITGSMEGKNSHLMAASPGSIPRDSVLDSTVPIAPTTHQSSSINSSQYNIHEKQPIQRSISGEFVKDSPHSRKVSNEESGMMFPMDEEDYHSLAPANTQSRDQGSRAKLQLLRDLDIEISRCSVSSVLNPELEPTAAYNAFRAHLVSHKELSNDPSLLFGNDIVFRIQGVYYPWNLAGPIIVSIVAFNKPLSQSTLEKHLNQWRMKVAPQSKTWGRWFGYWGLSDDKKHNKHHEASNFEDSSTSSYSNAIGAASPAVSRPRSGSANNTGTSTEHNDSSDVVSSQSPSSKPLPSSTGAVPPVSSSTVTAVVGDVSKPIVLPRNPTVYYMRSLKPPTSKLKALNLKPGPNKIVFTVNSRLQGSQELTATIYLWSKNAKIVISDIDGTITKSDVLGQIFPVFGKDWSHSGVAALFQSIKANGYEVLYLTARAIGASKITKGFLTNLQQDSIRLPDGPVFMSPDRLLHSLNREVILRRPDQFKIECLNEIRQLFGGVNARPFYAGFGNRDTDATSYVAVGIPVGKTFTIDPSGEITGHSKSIQKTYTTINDLVEQMFPPYHENDEVIKKRQAEQWNDFQFWESRPGPSLDDIEKELLK